MSKTDILFSDTQPGAAVDGVTIKSPRELDFMRQAGQVVASVIARLTESVAPGMTTLDCDVLAEKEVRRLGAVPSFKGYRGFPGTICVSINEQIVHGIPGSRIIRGGDLVSFDVGAIVKGFHGDAAVTLVVGDTSRESSHLIEVTREALNRGIEAAQPGNRVGDISAAVEQFVKPHGYSLVREYVGHGIGRALHEEPPIPNYGPGGRGRVLKPGMVIAIEPMVNIGDWRTQVLEDEWTVVTSDGTLSAHFEHTVAITESGPVVLTSLAS